VRISIFVQIRRTECIRYIRLTAFLDVLLLLAACGGGGGNGGTPPAAPYLDLTVTPSSVVTYPSSSFTVNVSASTNASVTPTIILGTLPAGISTNAMFPLSVPSEGASITFQTTATIAAGNFSIAISGQAGSATASASIAGSVQTNPPAFYFVIPLSVELSVSAGGSAQIQFMTQANGQAFYNVQLSVGGLPPGTSATISPQTITPGQSTTVTVTASSSAPQSQNTNVTLTGTPLAPVSPASITFLLSVIPAGGSLADNRTDYVSTEDTPFAAVYDAAHGLIFASNPSWNRVDVISATTHAIVNRISIREPRGIDLSHDSSTVWVATGSRQIYAINTTSFALKRYLAPQLPPMDSGAIPYWEGSQILALSDGTMMMVWTGGLNTGIFGLAIWDPSTNALTQLTLPTFTAVEFYSVIRSGEGTRVYFVDSTTAGDAFYYNTATKTFSNPVTVGEYASEGAVNQDGSRLVLCSLTTPPGLYDGNFNFLGPVPACAIGSGFPGGGGSVFSSDSRYLYQEYLSVANIPLIAKIDTGTLQILSLAPAMPLIPVNTVQGPPFDIPVPFGVDSTGMVFGIEDWGIAFDDGAFAQNYSPSQPGSPTFMQHMDPYFGPLSGGTQSGGFGNAFTISPTVWYGSTRGTASLSSSGSVTITSPPGSQPGPVNIKMLFPDGTEVFDPLFFSYGTYLQYALTSGAPPQGDVPGQVVGYGMPGDDSLAGTLTVGGSNAALQGSGASGLPFAGTPFPNKVLSFTVPPGNPGWADISLSTPDGSSALSKSLFYAKSVTDYSSPDKFTSILYDGRRQQLYLSAGDHIDVFSLTSSSFVSPLNPPATGNTKQFAGLALTPDGSLLLAADLKDGSLAAISPDNPSNNFTIPITPASGGPVCFIGPLYVAAIENNLALVVTGGIAGTVGCGPDGGPLYLANLANRTAGLMYALMPTPSYVPIGSAAFVSASNDGAKALISTYHYGGLGFSVYDVATNTYSVASLDGTYGAALSGDGKTGASAPVFTDNAANVLGRVAKPDIYYSGIGTPTWAIQPLQQPQFNDSGSLFFIAYPNFIDIIDVQHSTLRMRFSLSETVTNTATPIAVDPGGRVIYLITNQGLTIVDLGEAPLSIGWITPTTASVGAEVEIRGSGFNSSTTATVGGQAAAVSVADENTLTIIVPNLSSGPATIILTNSDGTTYGAAGLLNIQ